MVIYKSANKKVLTFGRGGSRTPAITYPIDVRVGWTSGDLAKAVTQVSNVSATILPIPSSCSVEAYVSLK